MFDKFDLFSTIAGISMLVAVAGQAVEFNNNKDCKYTDRTGNICFDGGVEEAPLFLFNPFPKDHEPSDIICHYKSIPSFGVSLELGEIKEVHKYKGIIYEGKVTHFGGRMLVEMDDVEVIVSPSYTRVHVGTEYKFDSPLGKVIAIDEAFHYQGNPKFSAKASKENQKPIALSCFRVTK